MIKVVLMFFLTFACYSANADEGKSSDKCMTEDDAFAYIDKLFDTVNKGNWIGGLILQGQLERCANEGSIFAKYTLGKWEYIEAKASAKSSHTAQKNSQTELSNFYSKSAQDDLSKALIHLESAAAESYPPALFKLGEIYNDGHVVSPSKVIAGKYFVKAGLAGFNFGYKSLANRAYEFAYELTPDHPDLPKLKTLVYE